MHVYLEDKSTTHDYPNPGRILATCLKYSCIRVAFCLWLRSNGHRYAWQVGKGMVGKEKETPMQNRRRGIVTRDLIRSSPHSARFYWQRHSCYYSRIHTLGVFYYHYRLQRLHQSFLCSVTASQNAWLKDVEGPNATISGDKFSL